MPYKVGRDEDGNVQLFCDCVEGGVLYPEEVSAYVVAELLSAAESFAGSQIRKAVISVRLVTSSTFSGAMATYFILGWCVWGVLW